MEDTLDHYDDFLAGRIHYAFIQSTSRYKGNTMRRVNINNAFLSVHQLERGSGLYGAEVWSSKLSVTVTCMECGTKSSLVAENTHDSIEEAIKSELYVEFTCGCSPSAVYTLHASPKMRMKCTEVLL
jgi:hypothetical protein